MDSDQHHLYFWFSSTLLAASGCSTHVISNKSQILINVTILLSTKVHLHKNVKR